MDAFLRNALGKPKALSRKEIELLLSSDDPSLRSDLFAAARAVKASVGKAETLPRGLIECSNVCSRNCLYCGIRRDRAALERYRLTETEALQAVGEARRRGYPAVAFQAGEIESEANTAYYERLLDGCRDLEVTLSLGEQTEAVYRRWREHGALRYLIRIETSNRALFQRIHPAENSFDRRLAAIRTLKKLGYVTGSGVMIGLPGQTFADLARDVLFFGDENLDMVGMGPFIPTPGTPMGAATAGDGLGGQTPFETALRMIALTRLYLHRVNIVAATALSALDPEGQRKGLEAGANVIMPRLTPTRTAADYALYPFAGGRA